MNLFSRCVGVDPDWKGLCSGVGLNTSSGGSALTGGRLSATLLASSSSSFGSCLMSFRKSVNHITFIKCQEIATVKMYRQIGSCKTSHCKYQEKYTIVPKKWFSSEKKLKLYMY